MRHQIKIGYSWIRNHSVHIGPHWYVFIFTRTISLISGEKSRIVPFLHYDECKMRIAVVTCTCSLNCVDFNLLDSFKLTIGYSISEEIDSLRFLTSLIVEDFQFVSGDGFQTLDDLRQRGSWFLQADVDVVIRSFQVVRGSDGNDAGYSSGLWTGMSDVSTHHHAGLFVYEVQVGQDVINTVHLAVDFKKNISNCCLIVELEQSVDFDTLSQKTNALFGFLLYEVIRIFIVWNYDHNQVVVLLLFQTTNKGALIAGDVLKGFVRFGEDHTSRLSKVHHLQKQWLIIDFKLP